MKTVRIPDTGSLWVCYINGARYAYEGGTTQAVPDEVAALIDGSDGAYPPASEATEEPFKPALPDGLVTQDDLEPYAKTEDLERQIATMPKNYESQDSMDELTEMLGEALNGTIVKTWDSAAGKYTYTFTPTPNPEET